MDMTSVMISIIAGLIGTGMLMFAKNTGRLLPGLAGIGLMSCPYVIQNNGVLLTVCAAFIAVPFLFRSA